MNARVFFNSPLTSALLLALFVSPISAEESVVDLRTELDRPLVLTGDTKQKVVLKVTLVPQKVKSDRERPPLNVSIVLDRSGSMNGEKIEQARQGALEVAKRLDDRDLVSLVTYSNQAYTDIPSASGNQIEEFTRVVQSINATGSTALYAGVNQGAAEIRKGYEGDYFHKIIVLSDGIANVGPQTPEDLERLGTALGNEGMSVCTVGLGDSYNEDVMCRLADATQSNTYYVAQAKDLPGIFSDEIGDTLNMVGKSSVIRISCAPGVWPVRSIGMELDIQGSEATGEYRMLYTGREKYIMLELEVEPSMVKAKRELAQVSVTFQDLIHDQQVTLEDSVQLKFVTDPDKVKAAQNLSVAQAIAHQEIAAAKFRAVEFYDEGEREKAEAHLNQVKTSLETMNASFGDESIEKRIEKFAAEISLYEEQGGLTIEQRKTDVHGGIQTRVGF